ncbi:YihY/virulence factor BrkB family protein [Streptomyces gobiensis]|uniref:YihY/virulence factor BrkB family protein n=1 Tax=Streptomyces gobiensis TaxID=2875706 RepID=UPI001E511441|nr:YihY/virulence factor BrkB family protein [Streptomyces gobiensis]UGY93230.1 YihY/virulence factor BrkB family protein [Streptomyces gobiensis]
MDWLTRQPVIGPLVVRLMRSHLWRTYVRLDHTHWSRLAAAITFISFLALFPMLALAAAIGAAMLTPGRVAQMEEWLADQVPGISDQLPLQSLVDNARTVGLIAGVLLLFTGLGWIRSLRECLREVWLLPEERANLVLGKLKDLALLAGLGTVGILSLGGSAFAVGAVDWAADQLGVDQTGPGGWLLRTAPVVAAVAVDFLLLWYVLTRVPGVRPSRRVVIEAGLLGAVGFELLKLLLGGYLRGVAAKNMYGAFGVPVALLVWISLMTKLLLFCAAWTATENSSGEGEGEGPNPAPPEDEIAEALPG